eukprot:maker-scaffold_1-snap-gene-6.4-mRNA-1 protein AED:0.00 eAED:0.00 QI:140/1/1/1/1/1/2/159/576
MKIPYSLFIFLNSLHSYNSLVITQPCCQVYQHRGAMFGPKLPVKEEKYFGYSHDNNEIKSVEGFLIDTTLTQFPTFCDPSEAKNLEVDFNGAIALIPRGGCSFAEKVYFAERAGAVAAIIYQSQDAHTNHDSFFPTTGNDDVIVMAEDSRYGHNIKIPSAFISYNSWRAIKETYNVEGENELLELAQNAGLGNGFGRRLKEYFSPVFSQFIPPASLSDEVEMQVLSDEPDYDVDISPRSLSLLEDGSPIYVVLNATGSLPNSGPDALPMMWDSMVFLIKVFVIIWTFMGFAYVTNFVKLRYRRYKRRNIIRSLPCKKYKHLKKKKSAPKVRRKHGKKFQNVETESDAGSPGDAAIEAERLLEEGNLPKFDEKVELSQAEIDNHLKTTSFSAELKLRSPTKSKRPAISQSFSAGLSRNLDKDLAELSDTSKSSKNSQKSKDSLSDVETDSDSGSQAEESIQNQSIIDCDNCVICLSEFNLDDYATVLPCKHIYHKECIEPWLTNKSSLCPICKQSIFKNGESRSISEINSDEQDPLMDLSEERQSEDEQRRGSIALSIGMFLVILLSFTFMMVDDNS